MKKRLLGVCLCITMMLSLLTGCVGEIVSVSIGADGSGKAVVSAGFTEEALTLLAEQEQTTLEEAKAEYESFAYNGVTYWGRTEEMDFKSIEELNDIFNSDPFEAGTFSIVQNDDGGITFKFFVTAPDMGMEELSTEMGDIDLSEEELEYLMKDMALVLDIYFPAKVYQVAGPTENFLLEGNHLKLDMMKLNNTTNKTIAYVFTTSAKAGEPTVSYGYSDVKKTEWYYDAVVTMSIGGLVHGVGEGKFAPEHFMTYAEFCQILARASGLKVGEQNGYWAYDAIKSCLDAGYIESRGDVTPANYDVPITREASAAGITRARAYELKLVHDDYTWETIPDYKNISEVYQADVVDAYRFGVVSGVDEKLTFNPNGHLLRAEICQMFYNIGWVTPGVPIPEIVY